MEENLEENLEDILSHTNGHYAEFDDALAADAVSGGVPFIVSVGKQEKGEAGKPKKVVTLTKTQEVHDKREQWKKFVAAYREEYLKGLRSGFNYILQMLNELSQEQEQAAEGGHLPVEEEE